MKKIECEQAVRHLAHKWRAACGLDTTPPDQLSFLDFIAWLRQNYGQYLQFRTSTSPEYDAEMWFDQEFKQASRR
jgi:hypothetical protein